MEIELQSFQKWVYKELQIDLSAYKSNQMNRRLSSFIARSGTSSVDDYIELLDSNPVLKQKLADFITINVSEFFRDKILFSDLEDKINTLLLNKKKKLKIWSAACSNGAEPYSIAIMLDRLTPNERHAIIGTDIDSTILGVAKKGEYGSNDIKNIDDLILKKHFKREGDRYFINSDIKNRVQFIKHDLILNDYDKGYDLITCRNVVIYFTEEVKEIIYQKFSDSLNPGGLFFVGATENIFNYKKIGFEKVSTFIYQKGN